VPARPAWTRAVNHAAGIGCGKAAVGRVTATLRGRRRIGGLPARRPGLVAHALGFAAGIGVFFLLAAPPALWIAPLAAALGLAAARFLPIVQPLALAALGFLWAQIAVCDLLCAPFPASLTRQDLVVTGTVASLPDAGHGSSRDAVRFLFRVDKALLGGRATGFAGLVRMSWYQDAPYLRVGERWRLTARLKPPHGFANPGGFDYERWLFQQGIKATGYVREGEGSRRLDPGPGAYRVDRLRQRLRERIGEVLQGTLGEALVRALVLGDRAGIEPDRWEALTATGTNHLIAISGLHVGMVASFLFFPARWAWSRSARLTLMMAAPRAAALAAFAAAAAYSALAGFSVSTVRALIMLAVLLGAVVSARTIRPGSGIALALGGVLLLDPKAVLSYGFWLSFGAVALLLYSFGQRARAPSGLGGLWHQWGKAQWAVGLGLAPLLLFLFGRASLVAPLANLIAVPLFSLVLLPAVLVATLLGLVPGLEAPLVLVAWVLEVGFGGLEQIADWPLAAATMAWRPAWAFAAACAGVLLLLAPRGLPGRWLGLVLLLPLAATGPAAPPLGVARFTLLDVGQGLAAVVETRDHVLVYDTGPRYPSGFNTGEAVVLPFLIHRGARRIDTLVISHADQDHTGGFAGLAGSIPIRRILAGEPHEVPGGGALPCLAGDAWSWDGVDFEVLHPAAPGRTGNESSCVLRIGTAGGGLLLTGDIGADTEESLVTAFGGRLRSTLLVASHHGSKHSSSSGFLRAVAPEFVLYGAGFANPFGFPTPEVRERVAAQGARQLSTASAGAIGFRLGATGIDGPRAYRRDQAHLWTHRTPGPEAAF